MILNACAIQGKVDSGEISYSKARWLTLLTRESGTTVVVPGQGGEPVPRTEKWFGEIRAIADDPAIIEGKEV